MAYNPLGSGDDRHDPLGGDGFAVVQVVTDIVPVRLVNTNPIPVLVTNFPNQPPPLPGLAPAGQPPPLPWERGRRKEETYGVKESLNELGLGGITRLASGAGAAAAGIGLMTAGALAFKSTFLDPLIDAARSGFHAGIARGAGVDVLRQSFEVLGVTIGTKLLPVTVYLAKTALVLAQNFERLTGAVHAEADRREGKDPNGGWGNTWLERTGRTIFGMLPGSLIGGKATLRSAQGVAGLLGGGNPKDNAEALRDVLLALKNQAMPRAQYVDVADLRAQAQLAALNRDPLEERARIAVINGLEKLQNEMAPDLKKVADAAQPPGGRP